MGYKFKVGDKIIVNKVGVHQKSLLGKKGVVIEEQDEHQLVAVKLENYTGGWTTDEDVENGIETNDCTFLHADKLKLAKGVK